MPQKIQFLEIFGEWWSSIGRRLAVESQRGGPMSAQGNALGSMNNSVEKPQGSGPKSASRGKAAPLGLGGAASSNSWGGAPG